MALFKHMLQSKADKSGLHCARAYRFIELVKFASLVANILPEREFTASCTTPFSADARKLLKLVLSESGTLCWELMPTLGTMLLRKERLE